MQIYRPFALAAAMTFAHLAAAPIPAEVWSAKEDQGTGAVIVSSRTEVNNDFIDEHLLVRILSEKGKKLISNIKLSETTYNIEGRTVLPDGKEIPFKSGKDFTQKTLGDDGKESVIRLLPPGLTGDCVVEVSWRTPVYFVNVRQYFAGRRLGFMFRVQLGEPCPVQTMELKVSKLLVANWNIVPFDQKPLVKDSSTTRLFTFQNLPAYEDIPFSQQPSRSIPYLDLYMNTKRLDRTVNMEFNRFWDAAVKTCFLPYYLEDASKGKYYRALSASLRENLKGSDVEKASEIMMRLEERIRNLDWLTDEEKQKDAREKKDQVYEANDLDEMAKRGSGHGMSIFMTYMQVLQDAGIPFKLALGSNRNKYLFRPENRNVNVLEEAMVAVEGPNHANLFFDPSERFMAPGTLVARVQGSKGMLIDPKKGTWEFIDFPVQAAVFNRSVYNYRLDLKEDTTRVQMETVYGGYEDLLARRRYIGKDASDQRKTLREHLEKQNTAAQVQKAEVLNVQSARDNVTLKIEATFESEEGRQRQVELFPLMDSPIELPATWAETRKDFILVPFAWTRLATCEFKLPKGYRLPPTDNLMQENPFGRVAWIMEEKEGTLKAVLRVDFNEPLATADHYGEFREFMGWVQEAFRRTLVLERVKL